MPQTGVYPASVTPLAPTGSLDELSLARLLAWFEASGCTGAVLAGTNGEGPSLSSPEKRDLVRMGVKHKGRLEVILGVATPSLTEANWLVGQACAAGADGVLLMPPGYFRSVSQAALTKWFEAVLERAELPVIVYNFPQMTGVTLSPQLLSTLSAHPRFGGVKDSSGDRANLLPYREAVALDKPLYVGDELLLIESLKAGWNGTISGCANLVGNWLTAILEHWRSGELESAEAKHALLAIVLSVIRSQGTPAPTKAVLERFGVIESHTMRLPLEPSEPDQVLAALENYLGMTPQRPGISG